VPDIIAERGIAIVLVAAMGENGVIGRDNALPWRMRSDLRHFRDLTINGPVVMGRRTYESIGLPLKDRTNIVITRNRSYAAPGLLVASTLADAMAMARGDALRRAAPRIAIIGGAGVFREVMPMADRLEMTVVHAAPDGDTVFPAIDPQLWREVKRSRHAAGAQDDADYSFVSYERTA
jgi:dihydrofolate reductase